MALHHRIRLTAWTCRLTPALLLVLIGVSLHSGIVCLAGIIWFFGCGPILRRVLLPMLFPQTTCPGCRRMVSLIGRWRCGDHYTDHADRHILQFHCIHGHRLEGFDCPRCRATITVQRGDRQFYRHGSAQRLRTLGRQTTTGDDGLLVGHDPQRRPVHIPFDRLAWHMAITGGTGRGKSTMLLNLLRQLALRGTGFTVLDPGGDLARTVLQHIPPAREAETDYIDVVDHPAPLNILAARDAAEAAVLTEELLGVFHKLYGTSWGPLLAHQLRMALRSVIATGGTLRDAYQMFGDPAVRSNVLARLRDADLRNFWLREFPTIPPSRHSAVTNKLAPVVFHPLLGRMLCARDCAVDADALIERRRILCVNLATGSPGDEVTMLLGTFLVQKILAAAFRQRMMPPEQRVPHVLVVDEFQRFMHRATGFDQILAEARKYRLSLVVANQFVEQLSSAIRAALFGNVGGLAAFRVGHRDAKVILPEFTGAIAEDLMELERGECLIRTGTDWVMVRTIPPPLPNTNDDPTARILNRTREVRVPEVHPQPIAVQSHDEAEVDELVR